jgi:glycosyltransferase involved in cell wall biosynthesis
MHHRVPIVAHAAAAVPETLGDAGLLLDAKDAYTIASAVHRVVDESALRKQLVEAGVRRLRDFDLEKSRKKLLDALEPVVGSPK